VPSRVKVVTDDDGFALYFSRSPIPFFRGVPPSGYLVHVGLYGYRMAALERFVALPRSPLEEAESLEQLRALQAGMRIAVGRARRFPVSVDTPEDYRAFLAGRGAGAP
jgi:3-deoxy-manno-octulosonate cytidylyltransferase (CMP-KDO synthetase)